MTVKPIPQGFHTVTPYLLVKDVGPLIDFLVKAFGAKESHRSALPDGTVTHADVIVGDSHLMMGAARGEWAAMPSMIYLYVLDTDAMYKAALAAGATSVMAPADQFYGDRNAGVKDPFGNLWWIATHIEDVSPEELDRRSAEHAKKQGAAPA
jgi:PhnB protein